MIEWIKLKSVPKISRIEKKSEIAPMIKDNQHLILGYTSAGNATRITSISKTIGDLAIKIKSLLALDPSNTYSEIFESTQFVLSTSTMIAEKFGITDAKEALVAIFDDKDTPAKTKAYVVLAKREQDENEPMKIEAMIDILQEAIIGEGAKDEL